VAPRVGKGTLPSPLARGREQSPGSILDPFGLKGQTDMEKRLGVVLFSVPAPEDSTPQSVTMICLGSRLPSVPGWSPSTVFLCSPLAPRQSVLATAVPQGAERSGRCGRGLGGESAATSARINGQLSCRFTAFLEKDPSGTMAKCCDNVVTHLSELIYNERTMSECSADQVVRSLEMCVCIVVKQPSVYV